MPADEERALTARRQHFRYRPTERNRLAPIACAERCPGSERYSLRWYKGFLPGYLAAYANRLMNTLDTLERRVTFQLDLVKDYDRLFVAGKPRFAEDADDDQAFGYRRVAGPNTLSLFRVDSLEAARARIRVSPARVRAALEQHFRDELGDFDLAEEARAGRVYCVDFAMLGRALDATRHGRETRRARDPGDVDAVRDTRWRAKYLPVPVGLFWSPPPRLEATLHPLAIQIDRSPDDEDDTRVRYPAARGEPGDWGWRIAKHYFEVADVSYHVAVGHVYGTHLFMEPFCLATLRQLPRRHPVHQLLRPHTRFTLHANQPAYLFSVDRRKTYFAFYSGTLETTRDIMIEAHAARTFRDQEPLADLGARGVLDPALFHPHRDDALDWREVLRRYVEDYVRAFYPDDARIRGDEHLQAWADELMDPARGGVRGMLDGDRLESREQLVDVLAQVLFVAGPGHAAQHYSSSYYYRFSPAFPGAAWAPPPQSERDEHEALYYAASPPIRVARRQFTFNSFTDYRYDRFGDYRGYAIERSPQAWRPVHRLREDLEALEARIAGRLAARRWRYDFLLPSLVPNSVTI